MSDTELMSGCIIRHRVVREEALHTAANGDGDEHGADYADSDESFVEEESPRSRYQRYLQSTLEEVSDPDDWCDIHYGHATQDSPVMEKEKMNLELFHQDPYRVVQKGMKSHNPNLCLYL